MTTEQMEAMLELQEAYRKMHEVQVSADFKTGPSGKKVRARRLYDKDSKDYNTDVKESIEIEEGLSHAYILQSLADKDINAQVKDNKIIVDKTDATATRSHLKKIGHDHLKVTSKGSGQVAEEVLDELSKKTLGSYINTATKDVGFAGFIRGSSDDDKTKSDVGKVETRRKKGISAAVKRLTKEEVVDEVLDTSKGINSYLNKSAEKRKGLVATNTLDNDNQRKINKSFAGSHKAIDKISHKLKEADLEEGERADKKKSLTAMLDRMAKKASENTKLQKNRAIKKPVFKEEVELDEGRIPVNHAHDAVGEVLGQSAAVKFATNLKAGTSKHTSWKDINSTLVKQGEQPHHIAKIAAKLKPAQYESVEELDELSKATLGSYRNKAMKQQIDLYASQGVNLGRTSAADYAAKKARDMMSPEDLSKLHKRVKGAHSAETTLSDRIETKKQREEKRKNMSQDQKDKFNRKLKHHELNRESVEELDESVNHTTFIKKYKENEDDNKHSENVVHLAKHFGSDEDKKEAHSILTTHNKVGNLTPEVKKRRDALHKKLWSPVIDRAYSKKSVDESVEEIDEKELTPTDVKQKEHIVKGMKKKLQSFKDRYGEKAKGVMYATATNLAKKQPD